MIHLMNFHFTLASLLQPCSSLHLHTRNQTGTRRDDTQLTNYLNSKLETGLVVRAHDKGIATPFVPASYWSNLIETPNSFFIYQQAILAVHNVIVYWLPHLGFIADPDKFEAENLWGGFGKTMYGHDANACDDNSDSRYTHFGRCTWLPSVGFDDGKHEYWECPGGLFPTSNSSKELFVKNINKKGAGSYAGRGCHFQQGGFMQRENELLADLTAVGTNCQCPCNDYISCIHFAAHDLRSAINKVNGSEKDAWFGYDSNICWVDSPKALAGIQNGLYRTRYGQGTAETRYWGWNEVVVTSKINSADFWLTHMIFIPAWLAKKTRNGFDENIRTYLGGLILQFVGKQRIKPGKDQIGRKPGSDVVFVEEIRKNSGDAYEKSFFCMQQDLGRFTVCSLGYAEDPGHQGHCYIADAAEGCKK